jgi:hypothetical protein
MEAPNRPLRPDLLGQGPTGHVILLLNLMRPIKTPLPFRQGVQDHFPFHFANFLSSLLTPL